LCGNNIGIDLRRLAIGGLKTVGVDKRRKRRQVSDVKFET
jgi:hypothetical protein